MSNVKTEDGRRAIVVNEIKPNSVAEDSNAIRLLFLPNVFFKVSYYISYVVDVKHVSLFMIIVCLCQSGR